MELPTNAMRSPESEVELGKYTFVALLVRAHSRKVFDHPLFPHCTPIPNWDIFSRLKLKWSPKLAAGSLAINGLAGKPAPVLAAASEPPMYIAPTVSVEVGPTRLKSEIDPSG